MGGVLTLEKIRSDAAGAVYPTDRLEGCQSALILFAAGFHGKQDAYWIAEHGLQADCVDVDDVRLREMKAVYPDGWRFTPMDVFAFAEATEDKWDLVSLDPPTNLFAECAEALHLWCRLANKTVILGVGTGTALTVPRRWKVTDIYKRSAFMGGVYWAVVEKQ